MTGSGFRLDVDANADCSRAGCFRLVLHQGSGRRQGEVQPVSPVKQWCSTMINDQLAGHCSGRSRVEVQVNPCEKVEQFVFRLLSAGVT